MLILKCTQIRGAFFVKTAEVVSAPSFAGFFPYFCSVPAKRRVEEPFPLYFRQNYPCAFQNDVI